MAAVAKDSNASAFDAGLAALEVFVDRSPSYAEGVAEDVVPLLVANGFNGRPKVVEKTLRILLLFVEVRIEKSHGGGGMHVVLVSVDGVAKMMSSTRSCPPSRGWNARAQGGGGDHP